MKRAGIAFVLMVILLALNSRESVFSEPPRRDPSPGMETLTTEKSFMVNPGEDLVLKFESKTREWSVIGRDEENKPLPELAERALKKVPAWLRKDLSQNMRALMRGPIYLPGAGVPTVFDINEDGTKDIIVGTFDGKMSVFLGPDFIEDKNIAAAVKVEGLAVPAGFDFNCDGHTDLVIADGKGVLHAFEHKVQNNIHGFSPNAAVEFESSFAVKQVLPVDLNGDGNRDLLFIGPKAESEALLYDKGNAGKAQKLVKIETAKLIPAETRVAATDKIILTADKEGKFSGFVNGDWKALLGGKITWGIYNDREISRLENKESRFCFGDITGDGVEDLVFVTPIGDVRYVENIGSSESPKFRLMDKRYISEFDMKVGYSPVPSFVDVNSDGRDDLVIGNDAGEFFVFIAPEWKLDEVAGKTFASIAKKERNLTPAVEALPGNRFIVCAGGRSGKVVFSRPGFDAVLDIAASTEGAKPSVRYSVPAIGDINGDGKPDIVVGTADGKLYWFSDAMQNNEPAAPKFMGELKLKRKPAEEDFKVLGRPEPPKDKKKKEEKPQAKPLPPLGGGYFAPRIIDINGDGNNDIVIGCSEGSLHAFLGPDWTEDTETFARFVVKGFSVPAFGDVNGDGLVDVLLATVDGTLYYYENIGKPGAYSWQEKHSWRPVDQTGKREVYNKYVGRYSTEIITLRGLNGEAAVNELSDLLIKAKDEYVDEISFGAAHLPVELLRTMHAVKQLDNLVENAKMIYEIAGKVKYAKLIEKGDHTVLAYRVADGRYIEFPRDIYYWYVAFPRVFGEIPIKVDSSYWKNPPEYYGQSFGEWQRFYPKESIYKQNRESRFWRSALPYDNFYKQTLIDAVQDAPTMEAAAYQTHKFLCHNRPGSFMTFGYLSNDIDPMIIYQKHYGSCGEQSLIGAACGRSMLIPTTVVIKPGEDHQWNEFYLDGRWRHWDVNRSVVGAIDQPWGSAEGFFHGEKASTIIEFRGDDSKADVTTRVFNPAKSGFTRFQSGYTDTADVTFIVKDSEGKPVDGAIILLYSHWVDRICDYLYTGADGRVQVHLGYEPRGGYTVEVLTPAGCAGFSNYVVEEGEKYETVITAPGKIEEFEHPVNRIAAKIPKAEHGKGANTVAFRVEGSFQDHMPLFTGGYNRMDDEYLKNTIGYRGTLIKTDRMETNGAVTAFIMDKYDTDPTKWVNPQVVSSGSFDKYSFDGSKDFYLVIANNTSIRTKHEVKLMLSKSERYEKPKLEVDEKALALENIKSGEKIVFSGTATDNLKLAKLEVSINGGRNWSDITSALDEKTGQWKYEWDTGLGGPLASGKYEVMFRAWDCLPSNVVTKSYSVELQPSYEFMNQKIFQDNPDNPLPKCSWIYGPFVIDEQERCIDIATFCSAPECDIDVWLYYDRNNNGMIDGEGEIISRSTNQSANEHILLKNAPKGTYWLYCQGWEVKKEFELFDVKVSFLARPRLITAVSPAGFVNKPSFPVDISLASPVGFDKEVEVVFTAAGFPDNRLTKKLPVKDGKVAFVVNEVELEMFKPEKGKKQGTINMKVSAEDCAGNSDSVDVPITLDVAAPEISKKPAIPRRIDRDFVLDAFAKDDFALESVVLEMREPGETEIKKAAKKDTGECLECLSLSPEKPKVEGKVILHKDQFEQDKYSGFFELAQFKPGRYNAVLVARDKAGNERTIEQAVEVIHPPLMIEHFEPRMNETINIVRPVIYCFAKTDARIISGSVKIFIDGAPAEGGLNVRDKEVWLHTSKDLAPGEHTVKLEVKDTKGRNTTIEHKFRIVIVEYKEKKK